MYRIIPPPPGPNTRCTTLEPPHADNLLLPYEYADRLEDDFGSITYQWVNGAGFKIFFSVLDLSTPQELMLKVDAQSISLMHMMIGSCSFLSENEEERQLKEDGYALFHIPKGCHSLKFPAGKHVLAQIDIEAAVVERLSCSCFAVFDVWERYEEKEDRLYASCIITMSNRLVEMLIRLLYNQADESIRDLNQQARVLDILAMYAEDAAGIYDEDNRPAPGGFSFSREDTIAVRRARELQAQMAGEELSLKDIARMVNMHVKKLQAGFKMLFGQSVGELTTLERIEKAKRLLSGTELSVTDIAYETGYCNASAFIRAFRRLVGVTPAAYRK
ncbi:helix-turn-helix domain-containing protein [Chitinophaga alhagiae]|uniref:helix-turn-helix domain-containing protein n=1 Tax=Chitinophaga alhagiae TaxID=2203219 RepID=UPI000E5AE94E|nr:AraC family transcriptional regulator [Chitinophaga alhagiae]